MPPGKILLEKPPLPGPIPLLARATRSLNIVALGGGFLLLFMDLWPLPGVSHSWVSACPLVIVGLAYLSLQVLKRPNLLAWVKAVMVGGAFILWGIDQLLPAGSLATGIGDLVIFLYVFDLQWLIRDDLAQVPHR